MHQQAARRTRAARALPYLAAFALSCGVMLAAFALRGIFPFGDTSVMVYDMPTQYVEFFGWLSDVLHGQADLFYANGSGLGGGTFSLFTYYLSSPFNLLAAAFAPENAPYLLSILYLVKIPAAAVTCLLFVRGRFGQGGGAGRQIVFVALAVAYSLTSYVTGYASNIMWLDGVIMLPLACLGVWRIVDSAGAEAEAKAEAEAASGARTAREAGASTGESATAQIRTAEPADDTHASATEAKTAAEPAAQDAGASARAHQAAPAGHAAASRMRAGGPRCVGLFAAVACAVVFNWYTGYMVCLFCLLYFAYEMVRARTRIAGGLARLRTTATFGATLALGIGAAACVLLPTAISLLGGKGAGAGLSSLIGGTIFAQNPLDLLSLMCVGTVPNIMVDTAVPALSLSALALVGAGAFLCTRAIPKPDRAAGGCLLGIMLLSVVLWPLTTVWSGFVPESAYVNRNGFAILFTVVVLAGDGASALARSTVTERKRAAWTSGIALVLLFLLSSFNVWFRTLHARPSFEMIALETALLLLYAALLPLALARRDSNAPAVAASDGPAAAAAAAAAHAPSPVDAAARARRLRRSRRARRLRLPACALLVAALAGEQIVGTCAQLSVCTLSASAYAQAARDFQTFYDAVGQRADAESAGYARIGQTTANGTTVKAGGADNMALLSNVSAFDCYSSTQESSIQQLLARLGYSKQTVFGTVYQSPLAVPDALLSVTGIVDDVQPPRTEPDPDGLALRGTPLFPTVGSLPLGYGTTGNVTDTPWTSDPFRNQELMLAGAANEDAGSPAATLYHAASVADAGSPSTATRAFSVTAQTSGPLYLYTPSLFFASTHVGGISCTLSVDGRIVQTVAATGTCNVVYAGEVEAGQTVQVVLAAIDPAQRQIDSDNTVDTVDSALMQPAADDVLMARTLDTDALDAALARVDAAGFSLQTYENGHVKAAFDAQADETLVFAIPAEPGWSATVDGQPACVGTAFDGLLSVPVSAGAHEVELRYATPGLAAGIGISLGCIAAFGVWRGILRARRRALRADARDSE